jgi:hypothetical protein
MAAGSPLTTVALLFAAIFLSACGSTSTESVAGPAPDKCEVGVTGPAASLAAGGGASSITVTTQPECTWTALAEAAWISELSPDHGQGSARVDFRAAQNFNNTARESAIVVNGIRATVRQSAAVCQFVASSGATQFSAAGGTGTITFSAPAGCTWVVSVSHSWIAVSPPSGTGTATISFSIASNTGGPRSGTVAVGGVAVTVNQAGAGPFPPSSSCTVALQPASASTTAAGGTGVVSITAASGCGWTASIGAPWITITTAPSGSGSGSFGYGVAANTTPTARTGSVMVAGATFTVNQAGTSGTACTVTINPTVHAVPATATGGSTTVSAPAGCSWTASSSESWLTVTAGASGTGNGSVAFAVTANTGPARTGSLSVGGQTLTVNQAGLCSFAIKPSSRNFDDDGGTHSVSVTAPSGCAWTATSNASFITITEGQSGSGEGTVTYRVAEYKGKGTRTGTLTIAGETFTVTQKD